MPHSGFHEGATVSLFVDRADLALDCRVVGFHRSLVVLERSRAMRGQDLRALTPGTVTYIVCGTGDRLGALRVQVSSVADERLVLRLLDRFTLGQRRTFSRLEAEWSAGVEGLDSGQPPAPIVQTTTIDVSAGGTLLHRPAELGEHTAYRVTLDLPGGRPPLTASAVPVRCDAERLALRFVELDARDEARIAEVILENLAAGAKRSSRGLDDSVAGALGGRQAQVDDMVAQALAAR
jgi:hypothetical protein